MAGLDSRMIGIAIIVAWVSGCAPYRLVRVDPNTGMVKTNPTTQTILFPDKSLPASFDNERWKSQSNPNEFAKDQIIPVGYRGDSGPPVENGGSPQNRQFPSGNDSRLPLPSGWDAWGKSDAHLRGTPTAAGAGLNLAPGESPVDRAVELLRRIDAATAENQTLQSRIRALEAASVEREQALNETLRDVDKATAEVAKARGEFEQMRSEMTKLRERVRRVEEEEVETLRMILKALEGLLPPAPAAPKP